MGLGAQRKGNNDQFGLDMYQGLLGRLNGKSDTELQKEEAGRRDVRLAILSGQRYGSTRFVSGGFLVGEKVEKTLEDALSLTSENNLHVTTSEDSLSSESKKRKRSDQESTKDASSKSKSSMKKQKAITEGLAEDKSEKDKKERRRKRREEEAGTSSKEEPSEATSDIVEVDDKTERKRQKAERKAQRQAKRMKKEERRRQKAGESTNPSSSDDSTDASTPQATNVAHVVLGRNLVRQRYIQQKRRACMDQSALNEIFMIKAPT
jgi:Pin2-interacting protein X1